jgi:hypothetical protein
MGDKVGEGVEGGSGDGDLVSNRITSFAVSSETTYIAWSMGS